MLHRIGPWELVLVAVVVLLFFLPGKLPKLAGALGATVKEFKRSIKPEPDVESKDSAG
jgi:TatA/E family protein of Tat protein translocase